MTNEPPPRRRFAIWRSEEPCTEHSVSYIGQIPCTGALRCHICGTVFDARTGVEIERLEGYQ